MFLKVRNINKSFDKVEVLTKVNFVVDEGHKIALVGDNGSGKSTLLKMITGEVKPDSGNIITAKNLKIRHLPQELKISEDISVLEYIMQTGAKEHIIFMMLDALGFRQELINGDVKNLSGGQKTKVLLVKFLLEDGDLLLFDEPTNNLDMHTLIWLETFLKESKKSMIIISHDIKFIDEVCNRVIEIKHGNVNASRGTYTDYLDRKEKEYNRQLKQYQEQQHKLDKLKSNLKDVSSRSEAIDKTELSDKDKLTAGQGRDVASKTQSVAAKRLKTRLKKMDLVEKPIEEDVFVIAIHPKKTEGELKIEVDELVAGFSDFKTSPISFELNFGKKVCLMGANGIGKSTIINTILQKNTPISGSLKVSQGIVFGDLMQEHQTLDVKEEVKEFVIRETGKTDERIINTLKKYGFKEAQLSSKISSISPGMRARLLFAIFELNSVNVLVLDEPTNHLDVSAVNALNTLLKEYKGTGILVSHNRKFLDKLEIDLFLEITKDKINTIKDFEEYIVQIKKDSEKSIARLKRIINF